MLANPTTSHWDGDYYHENSKAQQACAEALLANYAFKGDEVVLDVGCGDGKITAALAQQVPNGLVIGVDNAASMVAFAKKTYTKKTTLNVEFIQGDAQTLTFLERFDLVVSFSCLHWVKNQLAALQGIQKSLKSGGKATIITYPKCYYWDFLEETTRSPRWRYYFEGYESPLCLFTPEEYRKLLIEVGLKPLRVEEVKTLDRYPNKQAYFDFIKGWLPHLERLPKHLYQDFLEGYCKKEFDYLGISLGGPIELPYIRMDVEAIKI